MACCLLPPPWTTWVRTADPQLNTSAFVRQLFNIRGLPPPLPSPLWRRHPITAGRLSPDNDDELESISADCTKIGVRNLSDFDTPVFSSNPPRKMFVEFLKSWTMKKRFFFQFWCWIVFYTYTTGFPFTKKSSSTLRKSGILSGPA